VTSTRTLSPGLKVTKLALHTVPVPLATLGAAASIVTGADDVDSATVAPERGDAGALPLRSTGGATSLRGCTGGGIGRRVADRAAPPGSPPTGLAKAGRAIDA
jgi:hypothetical protein